MSLIIWGGIPFELNLVNFLIVFTCLCEINMMLYICALKPECLHHALGAVSRHTYPA